MLASWGSPGHHDRQITPVMQRFIDLMYGSASGMQWCSWLPWPATSGDRAPPLVVGSFIAGTAALWYAFIVKRPVSRIGPERMAQPEPVQPAVPGLDPMYRRGGEI